MILITTSRRPTQRMRTLCHDLNRVLPNTLRINRGKLNISGVMEKTLEYEADRVIIIERHKGGPGRLRFYGILSGEFKQLPPQIHLAGIKTQDDLRQRKTIHGSLAITTSENPTIPIKKLAVALSNFLRIPYFETNLNPLKFRASIHLSPTPKYEAKISFTMPPIIKEVGPILIVKYTSWQGYAEEQET